MRSEVRRLMELPQQVDDTWQGAVVQLPLGPEGAKGLPKPVSVGLCGSAIAEFVRPSDFVTDGEVSSFELLLEATLALANDENIGYRPGTLEVNDVTLADRLGKELAPADIHVEFRLQLTLLAEFVEYLLEELLAETPPGGKSAGLKYLDGERVSVEVVRAFAEGAAAFARSAVWQHLGEDDLVQIAQPDAPQGMRYASVIATRKLHAVVLFPSAERFWAFRGVKAHEELLGSWRGLWHVAFLDLDEMPPLDGELWRTSGLPVVHEAGCPSATYMGLAPDFEFRRPNAEQLTFLEGLLRALADTGEDALDTGCWTKEVSTHAGKATYELKLPLLLDPPAPEELVRYGVFDHRTAEGTYAQLRRYVEEKGFQSLEGMGRTLEEEFGGEDVDLRQYAPRNALEEAQGLCYEAFRSIGRRRVVLARRALRTLPDCTDAYVLLAEAARTPEEAAELYAAGVEAGKRTLGVGFTQEYEGDFWSAVETRPFMRALHGLAREQILLGRVEEGIANMQELMRLNPLDNQGVLYQLLPLLIADGRLTEAEDLLANDEDDPMAVCLYCRALLAFCRHGDTPTTRRLLAVARAANPHVPAFLLGKREPPERSEWCELGSEEEAAVSVEACILAWNAVPGAMDWLERRTKPRRKKGTRGGRHKRDNGKR